jgi:hypothetical protein
MWPGKVRPVRPAPPAAAAGAAVASASLKPAGISPFATLPIATPRRRGERGRSGLRTVRLQQERREVEIGLTAEAARRCGCRRHRGAHERDEVLRRAPTPVAHEIGAGERARLVRAAQIRLVAARAIRDVRRAARGRLLLGIWAALARERERHKRSEHGESDRSTHQGLLAF